MRKPTQREQMAYSTIARLEAEVDKLKAGGWIKCSERLPEPGVTVLVYTPPQPGDYPDDVRISFDGICPESDGDYWLDHGEHYEHFMALGGYSMCGPGVSVTGPSQAAPYTHWMPMPEPPTE